jgi:hypothetical protein
MRGLVIAFLPSLPPSSSSNSGSCGWGWLLEPGQLFWRPRPAFSPPAFMATPTGGEVSALAPMQVWEGAGGGVLHQCREGLQALCLFCLKSRQSGGITCRLYNSLIHLTG